MNILALNGSPKKAGIVSTMIGEACRGFREAGHSVQEIFLKDLGIADCTGCMTCQSKGQCIIRDDIAAVEEAIRRADVMIIGTPTHWGNMSAILLRTFERLFGFLIRERPRKFPIARNAKGKRAIIIASCSTAWPFNYIFNQTRAVFGRLNEICKYSGIEIARKVVVSGTITKRCASEKDKLKAYRIGYDYSGS